MAPSAPPDKGVLVGVPVIGGTLHGLLDLGPCLKATPLQRKRAQHLPPRLQQVQIGGIDRLEHKLPTRVNQREQQHVHGGVGVEIVHHRIDPVDSGIDPALDLAEEVNPVRGGAAGIRGGEGRAAGGLQGAKHVSGYVAAAIVDFLLGSFRLWPGWLCPALAGIALGGLRPHFVKTDDNTGVGWGGIEVLNSPLLRSKSGSTRAPNQVSSSRHFSPSASRISLIRLRFMPIPFSLRCATRRSSLQQANGRSRSDGRLNAAVMTALRSWGVSVGGRPERISSCSPGRPRALNRLSQNRTEASQRSRPAAISGALSPSTACWTICARRTKPAPNVRERVIRANSSASPSCRSRTRSVMTGLRSAFPPSSTPD